MPRRDGTYRLRAEDLAAQSYRHEGVWYDVAHKVYKNQGRAADDPGFRQLVDDLVRAGHSNEPCTIDRTPTRERTDSEIIVWHRSFTRPGRGDG